MPNSDTDRRPTPERFSGLVPGFPGAGGAHGAAVRRCLAGGAGLAPIAHGAVVVILGLPLPKRGAPAPVGSPRADAAAAAALRSASLIASTSASKRGRSATVSPASSSPIERVLCGASSLGRQKSQQQKNGPTGAVQPAEKFVGGRVSGGGGGATGTTRGAGEPRTFRAVEHVGREIVRAFLTVPGPQSPSRGRGRGPADRRITKSALTLGHLPESGAKGRSSRHDGGRQHRRSPRRGAHARLR